MFELYGKKQRCLWCGRSSKESYREVTMRIKYAKPENEQAVVCSDICGQHVKKTCEFIGKGVPFYIIGNILGIILLLLGMFIFLILAGVGILMVGLTILIFPFVTPQTVRIFGLRNGMLIGRTAGVIILMIGIMFMLG